MSTNETDRASTTQPAPEAQHDEQHQPGEINGRHDGLRPFVYGGVPVCDRAKLATADRGASSLIDALWASEEVMALNAELGLTMEQLVRLVRAISPQPAQAVPLSDEQINANFQWGCGQSFREFARAIERACAEAWGVKLAGGGEQNHD